MFIIHDYKIKELVELGNDAIKRFPPPIKEYNEDEKFIKYLRMINELFMQLQEEVLEFRIANNNYRNKSEIVTDELVDCINYTSTIISVLNTWLNDLNYYFSYSYGVLKNNKIIKDIDTFEVLFPDIHSKYFELFIWARMFFPERKWHKEYKALSRTLYIPNLEILICYSICYIIKLFEEINKINRDKPYTCEGIYNLCYKKHYKRLPKDTQ